MSNLRTISKEELDTILKKHKMWLNNEPGGERANLSDANLRGTNLIKANLRWANLIRADLSEANLSDANLSWATLRWINLSGAKLRGAKLRGAYLSDANLSGANLNGANLREAYLSDANLSYATFIWANLSGTYLCRADLSEAYLSGANLTGATLYGADLSDATLRRANLSETKLDWPLVCPEKGSFVGYKKCRGNLIVELEIQEAALRSSSTTRKCRCSKAKVLSITNLDGSEANVEHAVSKKDSGFIYKVGEVASVDDFDTNRWNECSTGIHFFMTREEAVRYGY